ncbi:MAG: zinc ribbon domain-containing protein [Oscillospiraceae bacterium]|nr:zinc ribbon domain-containing protein [Oscillospiraceae bacterium]
MESKICPQCGAEIKSTAKFCDECGANISAQINTSVNTEGNVGVQASRKTNKNHILIVIGVVIIVLLFGILCIKLVSNNSSSDDSVAQYDNVRKQYASNIVMSWYSIDGNNNFDEWNVYMPYIENGYVYIPVKAQINSEYTVQFRGFGTASINDTFSKTVPLEYEYENSTVQKGVYQKLTIRVPIADLDVQRPTTLYCQLATYVAGRQQNIKIEFDISW